MRDEREHASATVRLGSAVVRSIGWRTVLRDAILVIAWVGVVSVGWGLLRWPTWAYYVVVFGGIIGYSLASEPWGESDGERQ